MSADPAHNSAASRLNAYFCATCGNAIVTVDRDEGVTPMFLACRATEGCQGRSVSQMYRVPDSVIPGWEWYRPGKSERKRMTPEMRDHIDRGGLALRRIGDSDGT